MDSNIKNQRQSLIRVLSRVFRYQRYVKIRLLVAVFVALLSSLVALAIPQILQMLIDGPFSQNDPEAIRVAVGIMLALGLAEAIFLWLRRRISVYPASQIESNMRVHLYTKLQDLPVDFHDQWPSGQLLSRAVSDLTTVRRWVGFGVVLLIANGITVMVGFAILLTWSPLLGSIFILCSVPLWVYIYFFEHKYSLISRESQDQVGDLATLVEESVHGIRVLKAFGRSEHALGRFQKRAKKLRHIEFGRARLVAAMWFWVLGITQVSIGICLFVGVYLAANGYLTAGELSAFFATTLVLQAPLETLSWTFSETVDAKTALQRFSEIMEKENTIVDPKEPHPSSGRPEGRIDFQDVHFRYVDAQEGSEDLLNGVNFTLNPGEVVALVGVTGSGKTLITSLMTRLYEGTSGSIALDGVDIRNLELDSLRKHVATAFEEATLFSASVRENILLGQESLDPFSDEAEQLVKRAVDVAQARFVYKLPQGIDTPIGEEGLSLSGGQRQRIALARLVAAKPAVMVLDDPLSALDVETEARVEARLRKVMAGTTALIVAHRPSTVLLADRVILLEKGRISATGTHKELLRTNEHYRYVLSHMDETSLSAGAR